MYQTKLKREDEYLELISWILKQTEWENDVMIIEGKEYDRFMKSDNEDDVMDMKIVESDKFYDEFKEITGINLLNIDNFVEMAYINSSRNDIEVIVNINDTNKIFIICV